VLRLRLIPHNVETPVSNHREHELLDYINRYCDVIRFDSYQVKSMFNLFNVAYRNVTNQEGDRLYPFGRNNSEIEYVNFGARIASQPWLQLHLVSGGKNVHIADTCRGLASRRMLLLPSRPLFACGLGCSFKTGLNSANILRVPYLLRQLCVGPESSLEQC
jgi:hypothetical protein